MLPTRPTAPACWETQQGPASASKEPRAAQGVTASTGPGRPVSLACRPAPAQPEFGPSATRAAVLLVTRPRQVRMWTVRTESRPTEAMVTLTETTFLGEEWVLRVWVARGPSATT